MKKQLSKNKDLMLLIAGKFVSMVGSNMQQFALSLYVFALTNSAALFASMLSISILPRLLLSPVAGVFGDWFDRKKMIVRLDLMNAFVLGLFAIYYFNMMELQVWHIFLLVVYLELTEIFYESSSAGIIPSIVEQDKMLEAKSLQSFALSFARLMAPMIGGVLYGFSGLLLVLIVNALSFLISGLSEIFINVPAKHKRPEKINIKAFFKDVKEGLVIIKNDRFISTIIALGTIVNFVIGPFFTVGFIVIIKQVLEASDFQFGMYQTIVALSMVGAPIIMTKFFKNLDIIKVCVTSLMLISVVILSIAIIPTSIVLTQFDTNLLPFVILVSLSFIVGLAVGIINIVIGTLFAKIVPVEAMGRTSTVMNLLVTIFMPIGYIVFGFLYDNLAPSYVIIISGSIVIITVLKFRKPLLSFSQKTNKVSTVNKGALAHEH